MAERPRSRCATSAPTTPRRCTAGSTTSGSPPTWSAAATRSRWRAPPAGSSGRWTPQTDRKWAIAIDGDDGAVGFVALFGLDRQLGPELAVLVGDPSAWGRGVAREAERQACNRAFSDHDAHRIHAEIPATNQAAQKVVTFLGFRLEGMMRAAIRRGDERVDNQVWGLLAEDFTGWD